METKKNILMTEVFTVLKHSMLLYCSQKHIVAREKKPADHEAKLLNGDCAEKSIWWGDIWFGKGNMNRAITYYTEAIQLDSKSSDAYKHRGICWAEKGLLDKAIADYSEAIRMNPKTITFIYRGNTWAKKGEHERAITDYSEAINLDPKSFIPFYNRGISWRETGHYEKAVDDFNEAFKLNPKCERALNNLSWLLATCPNNKVRNGEEALQYAKKACELTQWQEAVTLNTLAAAYAESGQFEQAIKWQRKAIKLTAPGYNKESGLARLQLYQSGYPYRENPISLEVPGAERPDISRLVTVSKASRPK